MQKRGKNGGMERRKGGKSRMEAGGGKRKDQGATMGPSMSCASDGALLNELLPVVLSEVQDSGRIAVGELTSHFNLTPTSLFLSVYFIPLPVRISVLLLSAVPLI